MAQPAQAILNRHKDWRGAFRAMRKLQADPQDTAQVFRIMQALNAGIAAKNYHRLLQSAEGGRIAYRRPELAALLGDPDFRARFAPGTVGAAYRAFLARTGYSADGLKAVSEEVSQLRQMEHPYAWFGRRERDLHDIWHVLTGYRADDPLGELCLVAFSYAQTGGLGWGFIALMGTLRALREPRRGAVLHAVWEGYRHGRAAAWLHLEEIERLFAEPLEAARTRLGIRRPVAYEHADALSSDDGSGWLVPAA